MSSRPMPTAAPARRVVPRSLLLLIVLLALNQILRMI